MFSLLLHLSLGYPAKYIGRPDIQQILYPGHPTPYQTELEVEVVTAEAAPGKQLLHLTAAGACVMVEPRW